MVCYHIYVAQFNYVICMIQVLNGLTQNISSSKFQLGKNAQESILDRLPNTTKEELLHVSGCVFHSFFFL